MAISTTSNECPPQQPYEYKGSSKDKEYDPITDDVVLGATMAYLFPIAKAECPEGKSIADEQEEYRNGLGLSSDDMLAAVIEESKREADKSNKSKHVAALSILMMTMMPVNNAVKKDGESTETELERQGRLGLTDKQLMERAMNASKEASAQGEEEYTGL